MRKKLFISCEGSDPECFEGNSLSECLGNMLITIDDSQLRDVINDIADFLADYDEEQQWAKTFLSNTMMNTVKMCYGYDDFETVFD